MGKCKLGNANQILRFFSQWLPVKQERSASLFGVGIFNEESVSPFHRIAE
jgi:hypothetical protein